MNPRVTAVTPLEGHVLLLQFNDGDKRRMDVRPYLVTRYSSDCANQSSFRSQRPTTAP